MNNYDYYDFDSNCNSNSNINSNSVSNLDSIINSLPLDELAETVLCNANNPNNQFTYCDFFNILLCYGSQFINLIYVLLFLYWWSNQSIYCFLMNQNRQLTNGINNMLQECLENCCR